MKDRYLLLFLKAAGLLIFEDEYGEPLISLFSMYFLVPGIHSDLPNTRYRGSPFSYLVRLWILLVPGTSVFLPDAWYQKGDRSRLFKFLLKGSTIEGRV
ncbi:hypothetical protein LD39_15925 [Halobacillus sp. BBL2006]|nr:hypothetical protein LD39_15925 [Halobacillus sp. BBL2006]